MGPDNLRFGTTISNLLSRQIDLNLDSVYSQIVQEERHIRAMRGCDERTPFVSFSATTTSYPLQQNQPATFVQAAASRFVKSASVCSHCGKQGHETSGCFQLICFPEWWEKDKTTVQRHRVEQSRMWSWWSWFKISSIQHSAR